MDFSFTEEQLMLRDSVSAYLAKSYDFDSRQAIGRSDTGWSGEVWSQLADMGLLALPFPVARGGLGGTVADVVAIAEPFGAHLLVEPYLASIMLAGGALAAAADNNAAVAWLERVIRGEVIAALAYEEGNGTRDPSHVAMTAERSADGFVLRGEKRMVLGGGDASMLVVVARLTTESGADNDIALFLADPAARGIGITRYATIDGRRAANIVFDGVTLPADALILDDAKAALRGVLDRAMLTLCAESTGAMGSLLARTADYAATRKQFGVPIGSFQVVAHRLADMKIAYTKARATLIYTTALLEAGRATPRDMAILKGQTGKLGRVIGEAAIQTHGGVGMTDELSIGHLHKRILANDALLGDANYHLRRVGSMAQLPA